ncbi:MAG: DNA repair protein RecO, partial [Lachnospiraceae bacterium]|nr:DNA repair protein RecO [Lachnospiraceae bacterium]
MIGTLTVNGMVLSAMPMGEYDKRLTILTVERGKINAFAKGARKPNSSLLACSQPFSYGEFTAYAGRDSYTVTNAVISNYFPELREDLERLYLGMYFCEFADYFTREGNDEREVLGLLYQSLRALGSGKFPAALVRRVYELKLVSIEGEAPQVSHCVHCGKRDGGGLSYFSLEKDGILCDSCARGLTRNASGQRAE